MLSHCNRKSVLIRLQAHLKKYPKDIFDIKIYIVR